MPIRPPRICAKAGCGTLVSSGSYCEKHIIKYRWSHKGSRQKRGYGRQWEKLRLAVLQRDSFMCQVCMKAGRTSVAREVDHIIPKSHGGTDTQENLQSICVACHREKSSAEGGAG